MQRRAIGFGLIAALCVVACKGKDERAQNAKKVTVSSTDDATEAIVDEDYRFRIDWPGEGWKLLREKDVKRLLPDAVAGAIYQSKVFGAVVVEAAPGVELESFAKLISDNMLLEEKSVDQFEKIQFDGRDAVKFTATGKANGILFRYTDIVFLHQGHAYQVIGWGMADQTAASGASFQPLFDAFHIIDGEVSGRSESTVVTEAHGVGWRVEEGVFESAVTGLRVTPAEPWRIVVGAELEQMSSDAEIGITRAGPEAYAVLVVERAPKQRERKAYAEGLAEGLSVNLGLETVERGWNGTFAGKPTEFRRYRTTAAPSFEYLYAVHFEGDQLVQVIAWYLASERDRVLPEMQAGFDTIAFMPADQTRALAAELSKLPDPHSSIGAGHVLRNGVYRDFARGWSWTRPEDGFWRLYAGEDARAVRPDLTLYMTEPALGIYGMILDDTAAGYTPESYHDAVLTTMEGDKKLRGSRTIGKASVRTSIVDQNDASGALRYHLSTLVQGDRAIQAIFWGTPDDVERNTAMLDAALDGFELADGPVEPVTRTGSEYRDERLGFAVKLPGANWQFQDMTPPNVREAGSFVFWQSGARMLGVVAIHALENADDTEWFLDLLEQLARDQFGQLANIAPKREKTTLAGVPARKLTWRSGTETLEAYLIVRGKTIYALLTAGPIGTGVIADALTGFKLLD